jgi:hypothetical protein
MRLETFAFRSDGRAFERRFDSGRLGARRCHRIARASLVASSIAGRIDRCRPPSE